MGKGKFIKNVVACGFDVDGSKEFAMDNGYDNLTYKHNKTLLRPHEIVNIHQYAIRQMKEQGYLNSKVLAICYNVKNKHIINLTLKIIEGFDYDLPIEKFFGTDEVDKGQINISITGYHMILTKLLTQHKPKVEVAMTMTFDNAMDKWFFD